MASRTGCASGDPDTITYLIGCVSGGPDTITCLIGCVSGGPDTITCLIGCVSGGPDPVTYLRYTRRCTPPRPVVCFYGHKWRVCTSGAQVYVDGRLVGSMEHITYYNLL